MKVFGLMLVRNEADILRINVQHHLALGVDRLLIVDNGSTDGTQDVLQELHRDGGVEWTEDPGPYRQSEITTELARKAFRQRADWIVPIDADEFWHAPGGDFHQVLESSSAGALQVEVINFIQRREQESLSPDALLHMTRRVALPVGPLERVQDLVEARKHAFVEMMYSPKWISRPSAGVEIAMGNHAVQGAAGPLEETEEVVCLHAPLRARRTLEDKVIQGARVEELGLDRKQGWHVRRWRRLYERGELHMEWCANSYDGKHLDVYGEVHPVVFDPTLRDVVARWIPWQPVDPDDAAQRERGPLLGTIREQYLAHWRESSRAAKTFRTEVAERDRIIRGLQAELQAKVSERDTIIRDLQAELHAKVGERDQIIRNLQQELHAKVGERDRIIRQLQAELLKSSAAGRSRD